MALLWKLHPDTEVRNSPSAEMVLFHVDRLVEEGRWVAIEEEQQDRLTWLSRFWNSDVDGDSGPSAADVVEVKNLVTSDGTLTSLKDYPVAIVSHSAVIQPVKAAAPCLS